MTFSDEIKALSKLPRAPYPFLSLYLNARWDSEKQRERVRIFVKTKLRKLLAEQEGVGAEALQSLKRDAEGIEQYVKGLVNREWDDGYRGIALFSCSGLGVHTLLRSHIPFEEAFHCGDRPALRPAAEQMHAGRPSLLCFVAGNSGRLLEFELGGLVREFRFRDEAFPGRHEQGGWSQGRFQRHVDEHMARNFKAISEPLVRWCDEKDVASVLLSGTEADLSVFEQRLPKRVERRVALRLRIDPSAKLDAILDGVNAALSRVRRDGDAEALDKLFEKSVGPGRASEGLELVAKAVEANRIHTLFIDRRFRESGWACPFCNLVGVTAPVSCPSCGKPVESVEVGEEFVRRTLASEGSVSTVLDHQELSARGGVAALLRYG